MNTRQGQSTAEFAVMTVAVLVALAVMVIYVKRGMAGRLKSIADSLGEQYEPRNTSSNLNLDVLGSSTTTSTLWVGQTPTLSNGSQVNVDVMKTNSVIGQDLTNRTGDETVGPLGNRLWDQ